MGCHRSDDRASGLQPHGVRLTPSPSQRRVSSLRLECRRTVRERVPIWRARASNPAWAAASGTRPGGPEASPCNPSCGRPGFASSRATWVAQCFQRSEVRDGILRTLSFFLIEDENRSQERSSPGSTTGGSESGGAGGAPVHQARSARAAGRTTFGKVAAAPRSGETESVRQIDRGRSPANRQQRPGHSRPLPTIA